MKTLHYITSKINTFFCKEDSTNGAFIGFFRIGTGVFVLIHLLSIILDFSKLYGKYGIIPHDIRNFLSSKSTVSLSKIISFFETLGIQEQISIDIFLGVFIFFILALITGFFTRFSALVTLVLYKAVYASTYTYGVDSFIVTSLFYLVIFPSGYFYSIDNLLFHKRKKTDLHITLFKRLLQLNLCIVYFFAGASKAIGTSWWNGEALWKSINLWSANSIFQFDYSWLAANEYILTIAGWGVLAIELLYFIFIWIPKTRNLWLIGTLFMHLGIGLLLDLYFFATFLMFWNIAAFHFITPLSKVKLLSSYEDKKLVVIN